MRILLDVPPEQAPAILAALTAINLQQIRNAGMAGRFPVLEGLISGAIRYDGDDPDEKWQDWEQILTAKRADCEDLVPAIAAEYLAAGVFARPIPYSPDGMLWHVVVEVWPPDGGKPWMGDPSVLGGMPVPQAGRQVA